MHSRKVAPLVAIAFVACGAKRGETASDDARTGTALEDSGAPSVADAAGSDASLSLDAGASRDAAQDGGDPSDAGDASDASDASHASDAAAADSGPSLGFDCPADGGDVPNDLACTGLYESWPDKRIAAGVRPYAPGASFWSDGAEKSRFVSLPPGTRIDTSDMNEWVFPVGTKLWKEFRLAGVRVETRFLWKRANDWLRITYAWSADQSSARALTTGATNVFGTTYEIPSQSACTTCHQGRVDGVLGFEAIGLSMTTAQGLTLASLVGEGLVTSAPSAPLAIPGNATESAALAWLHANCGTACHNRSPDAFAGDTGLFMRLDVERLAAVAQTDTITTAVGVVSGFQPFDGAGLLRIAPGDPSRSAIAFRISFRDTQGEAFQMPPIDTHLVDADDARLIASWIGAMTR
jgi:hypothetical protein